MAPAYSREQLDIIEADATDVQVIIAGAGVGKTATVVGRLGAMVRGGVPPQGLLLLSHTNSACHTLRQAAARGGGLEAPGEPHIMTLHALAARVTKSDQTALDTCIDDAVEMLEACSSAVPIHDLRHVFVDETQDLSASQLRLVRALVIAGRELGFGATVVGDERQAIYGFSGADVTGFGRLADELRDGGVPVATRALTTSFRCTPAVAALCNYVACPVFTDSPPLCAGGSAPSVTPQLRCVRTENLTPLVVHAVRALVDDHGASDVMVLGRTNRCCAQLAASLRNQGIGTARNEREFDETPAVRVMTIHTAKGMEAAAVIACELAQHELVDTGVAPDVGARQAAALAYTAISRSKQIFIGIWNCDPGAPRPPAAVLRPAELLLRGAPVAVGAVAAPDAEHVAQWLAAPQPKPRELRPPANIGALLRQCARTTSEWFAAVGSTPEPRLLEAAVFDDGTHAENRSVPVIHGLGLPVPSAIATLSVPNLVFHANRDVASRLQRAIRDWDAGREADLGLVDCCMDWATGCYRTSGPMRPQGTGPARATAAECALVAALREELGAPLGEAGPRPTRRLHAQYDWHGFPSATGGNATWVALCDDIQVDVALAEGLVVAAEAASRCRGAGCVHACVVNVRGLSVTHCDADAGAVLGHVTELLGHCACK